MNKPKLDERLSKIYEKIQGQSFADVGCDHGKLSIVGALSGKFEKIVSTDISAPSLAKTQLMVQDFELGDIVECRVGNGLQVIKSKEVDTVVVAGMGGDLICEILKDAMQNGLFFDNFVLCPHRHADKVRKLAIDMGFSVDDDFVRCDRKYYNIISLSKTQNKENYNDLEILFGKNFENECFQGWLNLEVEKNEKLLEMSNQNEKIKSYLSSLKEAKYECSRHKK